MSFKNILLTILVLPMILACPKSPPEDGILVFSKTEGYRHQSIEIGQSLIQYLGKANNYWAEPTEDASLFNSENLKRYKAVIFLNTTGDVLNKQQQDAFQSFVNNGGGFMGIHAAADTEYDWPWYGRLVGAHFDSHPDPQDALIKITDSTHSSTKNIPLKWEHFDEWYNYKNISTQIKVVAQLDEKSYSGGTHGDFHPIAWYQEFDGGKVFYTGFGHTKETYNDELFIQHILGGIQYILGR